MKLESVNQNWSLMTIMQLPQPVVYCGDMPSKSAVTHPCRSCKMSFSNQQKLREHFLNKHKDDRPYACHLCDSTFASSNSVKRHLNEVHVTESKFACTLCDRKFKCADYLGKHMKNHHGLPSSGLSQKTKSDRRASSKECSSTKSVKKEKVKTQKRPLPKKSSSGSASDADDDEEWQQRPQKKKTAASVPTKKRKTRQSSPKSEDDDDCTADVDSSNLMDQQPKKRSRWSDKDSKDSRSGLSGTQPVIKLEKVAEKPVDLSCHICKKPFNNQEFLKRHLRCHIPPKVYACDRCDEKFMSETFYMEHLAIHAREEEKSQLSRSKKVSGLIRYYTRKRTDLLADDADPGNLMAEFECSLCGVKYNKEKDLRQHVKKTHSDGTLGEVFCCTLCTPAKHYEKEYNFRAHFETVHEARENREYVCVHCSSKFRYEVNLQFHLKHNHAESGQSQ